MQRIEARLNQLEEQAKLNRQIMLAFRWNLLKTIQFAQEIVRDAEPTDPKIQQLEEIYQEIFSLKI
jgi:hypothetical protein